VLVVDDEAVIREVLTEALENEGGEVLAAESGEGIKARSIWCSRTSAWLR